MLQLQWQASSLLLLPLKSLRNIAGLWLIQKFQDCFLEQGGGFGWDAVTGLREHLVAPVTFLRQLPGILAADNRIIGTGYHQSRTMY
jgi:hypothetical protein